RPYDPADPASAFVDTGDINFEIGVGVKITVNVTGDKIFGNPDGLIDSDEDGIPDVSPEESDNLFHVMNHLIGALETSDYDVIQRSIGLLDSRIDKVLTVRTDIGAKTNR